MKLFHPAHGHCTAALIAGKLRPWMDHGRIMLMTLLQVRRSPIRLEAPGVAVHAPMV
jgi:hypothetical protein